MPKHKRRHPHAHLLRLYDHSRENVPQRVKWPGVGDPSLAAPDMIKFDYAEFASHQEPGQSKLKQLEDALGKGPLGFHPEIEHWAMEEFFWHGSPGDDWHPLEAYLAWAGDRFPSPAQEQLRRWKEARIGLYEVGDIHDGTVGLQEQDPANNVHCGPPMRAIALSMGRVNDYRGLRGQITLTYVAPWAPEENLFCAMGYGVAGKKRDAALFTAMLGLRRPEIVSQPYPWKISREAGNQYLRQWQMREWHGWLKERLVFPFRAWLRTSERGKFEAREVTGLTPMEPEMARNLGLYLEVPTEARQELILVGLTAAAPLDIDSPNWMPIAEYQAYRERVGPPPGTIGQPSFMRLR